MHGYMGIIRVYSKNYTEYEDEKIKDAINVAKLISREENLEIFDQDYANYEENRKKFFIQKEEELRLTKERENLKRLKVKYFELNLQL